MGTWEEENLSAWESPWIKNLNDVLGDEYTDRLAIKQKEKDEELKRHLKTIL